MSKMTMTAIFATAMALSAPLAQAQTTTTTQVTRTSTVATVNQMTPDEIRATKFMGSTVYDVENRNIGDVKDMVFNREGRIDAVVLDVGAFLGMGGKYVAVKLADIKTDNNRLTLDMTKEQLKSAQAYLFNDQSWGYGSSTAPTNRK